MQQQQLLLVGVRRLFHRLVQVVGSLQAVTAVVAVQRGGLSAAAAVGALPLRVVVAREGGAAAGPKVATPRLGWQVLR
jgi:hypothetical protein